MRITLTMLIMLAFINMNAKAQQNIIAGSHGSYYHAYQPNLKIYCFSDTTSLAFDINGDNQEDLNFETYYSQGSSDSYTNILNYNSNLDIAIEKNNAAKLKAKDTIQNTLKKGVTWSNASQSVLREIGTDKNGIHSSGNWNTSDDGYLAFRLRSSQDTLYGWYNLSVSAGIMYIKELSFEKNVAILGTKKGVSLSNISLYPNPSNGLFMVTGIIGSFTTLEIFNNTGSMVMNVPFENNKEVDCTHLTPGFYIIKITGTNEIRTSKICIK